MKEYVDLHAEELAEIDAEVVNDSFIKHLLEQILSRKLSKTPSCFAVGKI